MNRKVLIGKIYHHFKGNNCKLLYIGYNSETLEKLVIYQDLNDENKIWVRPYDMFVSLVNKNKYPDIKQKYRFELIKIKERNEINGKSNKR